MTIDRKKLLEFNLNTIIQLLSLAAMVIGGVTLWVNQARDIEEMKKWQADHDRVVEARLAESREIRGQTEERLKSIEREASTSDRNQDQIQYRVTVLETATASQAEQQQRLTEALAEIKGDMKVVKELLVRMDAERKRTPR